MSEGAIGHGRGGSAFKRGPLLRAHRAYAVAALILATLAGCAEPETAQTPRPATDFAATDAWLGRWLGPEGTYLEINGGNGRYELIVADLDGPRSYEGQAQGGSVVFERDGNEEAIRATDGTGTGMKWLAEQANCLVIKAGEGFCRP